MLLRFPILLAAAAMLAAQTPRFEGTWLGTLEAGPAKLRLVLHLSASPSGLTATLDSLDQGALGLAATPTVNGRAIAVEIPVVHASFEGRMSEDGQRISGALKQAGATLPLTFEKVDRIPETRRPQDPAKPYPYGEEEVTYSGRGGKLAGTLTLPRGTAPVPAVLLLTGSGPQDRNEALMGHRPFLVLADALTRRGIAVLRMDDRGVGGSTGSVMESTQEDFAADALAGVAYLKTRQEVDASRIGLLGHSEGGQVAALAAAGSREIAFLVMLAGPGIPGDQLILRQVEMAVKGAGMSSGRVADTVAMQRRVLDIVLREKDGAAALEKLREALAGVLEAMPEAARKAKESELKMAATAWYRSFVATDPRRALARIHAPVLALNGELDSQVPAAENLASIEAALKAAGNTRYTTVRLPGLNHLFQKAQSGSIAEYREIEETINPEVLRLVGDWIVKQTAK